MMSIVAAALIVGVSLALAYEVSDRILRADRPDISQELRDRLLADLDRERFE